MAGWTATDRRGAVTGATALLASATLDFAVRRAEFTAVPLALGILLGGAILLQPRASDQHDPPYTDDPDDGSRT